MLVAGSMAHSLTGRGQAPSAGGDGVAEHNLYNFHRFAPLSPLPIVALFSGATACHYFALDEGGALYAWGRNERGQLGLGDTVNRYAPVLVPGLPPVLAVAAGKAHSVAVCAGGEVFACGDNSKGQCGLGKAVDSFGGMFSKFTRCHGLPAGAPVAPSVGAGAEFSVVCAGGAVYCAGSQQYGQCGNGTTGEYIVHAGKSAHRENLSFLPVSGAAVAGVAFTAVAAGANHCVALSRDGVPFTWGFGAYGRLGHGAAADVLTPTPIKYFEANERLVRLCVCVCVCPVCVCVCPAGISTQGGLRRRSPLPPRTPHSPHTHSAPPSHNTRARARLQRIASIAAGNAISFFTTRVNSLLYHVGISKKSGEATMRPTYFADFSSMRVTGVAAGATSIIVSTSENSTVAFGPSPTYGELGFGEASKSSVKPKLVDDLEGLALSSVAMGLGLSMVLVEASAERAAKFPVYDPKEPAGKAGGGAEGAGGGGKRKAGAAAPAAAKKAKK